LLLLIAIDTLAGGSPAQPEKEDICVVDIAEIVEWLCVSDAFLARRAACTTSRTALGLLGASQGGSPAQEEDIGGVGIADVVRELCVCDAFLA
jgi:hypothetical protein